MRCETHTVKENDSQFIGHGYCYGTTCHGNMGTHGWSKNYGMILKGVGSHVTCLREGHLIDVWERPEDYIAGSKGVKGAGGLFSRSMCVVRVHGVDAHAVRALDLYYQALASSFESAGLRGKIAYERAVLGDLFLWLLGLPLRQHGNCSQWVSRGLFLANLVKREYMFPKALWVDLFETHVLPTNGPPAEGARRRERRLRRRRQAGDSEATTY